MALNLGELFGTIGLDASDWHKELQGAQGSLKAFGVAGAALAATAAVAIGAALTKGVVDSMDIEAGNDKMQAQLGLTEAQAETAGKAAGSLYASNYGASMEEVQTATAAVMSSISGMRDASQADIEGITKSAINLANTFDVDVAEASASAGALIKNGLAKDAGQAMDLITDSMKGVPASMRGEIFPIMDEYGKHFKTLGFDGTTAMGIVKMAAQDGAIGMDKMGDALKEFTLKAVSTDKPVVEAFESIGLSSAEMAAGMAAGGEAGQAAFAKTIAGLQAIEDPALQAQTAIALFGTPLEDLGTDSIPAFLGQLDPMGDAFADVSGASAKLDHDLNANAKAGFGGFMRQAEAALITFVQGNIMPSVSQFATFLNTTVGPAITQLGAWITTDALPALRGFGQWFTDNQDTITNWATGIGFLLIPLFLRIAISATVSAAAQVVAWATAGAGAVKTAAIYVAQSYIMVGRFVAMTAAAVAHGVAVGAVWTGQVIMGIVNAAIAFTVQSALIIGRFIAMSAAAVAHGAVVAAVWTGQVVASAASAAASFLVTAGQVVGGWVLMGIQSLIQAARMAAAWLIAMGPVGWVIAAVVGLVALIVANWSSVSRFTSEAWSNVTRFVADAWRNITSGVSSGIDNVVGFVRGLPGQVLSALGNLGGLLLGAGGQIIEGFLKGLQQGFENVKNFVGGIGQWIADHKGPKAYDLALLVPAGGWIMDGLETGIQKSMPSLRKTLGNVSATIATGVTGGTVGLAGIPSGAANAAPFAGSAPVGGVNIGRVEINQQRDPQATFMEFSRRVGSLTS